MSKVGSFYARGIAIALVLIAILAFIMLQWFNHLQGVLPAAPVGVHVIATPAKQVVDIPKHQAVVKSGSVRVYESRAKNTLKLPEAIKQDEAKQVLESTRVDADDHDQTITTILDTETGDTQTLVRREPLPWIAWRDDGSAGLYAGIKNGTPTARLELKQSLFSVKAIRFGAVAAMDQPLGYSVTASPDYFVGVGAEYRW
ncbi:MAG: hypothetical protein Q8M99_11945 [Methylotenera sp.]|nr:hypothetical protein [Methylotenera sp.]